jgi:PAS domain S-box-containing protein
MNPILILTLTSLFFVLLSFGIILLWKYQRYIYNDVFFILLGILALFLLDHVCNIFEWSGLLTEMDEYGDFLQILEPLFLGILVYALIQHRLRIHILNSEAKYRLLVDNQTDLVIKLDPEGNFLFASPSYCRLFGHTEKELMGRSFLPDVHPEDLEKTRREMEKLSLPPYSCLFRQRAHTKYGWRHFSWAFRVILDEAGKSTAIVGMGRDITDRVEIEHKQENLLKKLETKNRELQNLVYISSHDLQSPLVNIRGFGGELKNSCQQLKQVIDTLEQPALREQIEPYMKDIQQALYFINSGADKMHVLIEGLLKLSRIGSVELTLQTVHMSALIRSIVESMRFQVQKSGGEIQIEDLPPCRSDLYQVNQIFSNLLDNAVKYLDSSRPGIIRVTGMEANGFCEYRVIDNGIGIEPESHSKIFEIFHRLDPEGPVKGLGLGLAIVQRILDKLNGSIRLISEPARGSEFIVTLPAASTAGA